MATQQNLFISGFKVLINRIIILCLSFLTFHFTENNKGQIYSNSINQYIKNDEFYLSSTHRKSKERSSILRTNSPSLEYLKISDIVFIGNSRPLFGLNHDSISKFSSRTKSNSFNLSFDSSDNKNLGLWILDQYKIKPKYLLVHVGPYIFMDDFSPQSFRSISNGCWANSIDFYDFQISSLIHLHIRAYFGQFRFAAKPFFIYRSKKNGCINLLANIKPHEFTYKSKSEKLSNYTKESALNFLDWARKQSVKPILFQVPAPDLNPFLVSSLAKFLGVPFILSPEGTYLSHDNSHLSPSSAKIFTNDLLAQLESLSEYTKLETKESK